MLTVLCLSSQWIDQDCVFAIREAAISNLRKLIEIFGPEWARRVVQQVSRT